MPSFTFTNRRLANGDWAIGAWTTESLNGNLADAAKSLEGKLVSVTSKTGAAARVLLGEYLEHKDYASGVLIVFAKASPEAALAAARAETAAKPNTVKIPTLRWITEGNAYDGYTRRQVVSGYLLAQSRDSSDSDYWRNFWRSFDEIEARRGGALPTNTAARPTSNYIPVESEAESAAADYRPDTLAAIQSMSGALSSSATSSKSEGRQT